ncbi:MAG: ATP-dependent DNA helicase [Gammaproteobacteria bacterium]|nr:MAG: ATP-dependent DNA helicase [Gammaproteobacteria bacterium]
MAHAVNQIVEEGGVLVTEAGTGTGKTFAYLIPAILSGKRVVIATGTKNLQDQLFHQDLPTIRKALKSPVTVALLKGRANYLCLHRLMLSLEESGHRSHRQVHELEKIRDWSERTRSGDIAEVDDVPESSMIWPNVTSTTDNCLGQDCPDYSDCFVLGARRKAQQADLVVINHHLFFADMALKEQGFGDILPGADVFILDEAHQLPEVASSFFGVSITSRQLFNLVKDTINEHLREAGDMKELPECAHKLEKSVSDLRLTMGQAGQRLSWQDIYQKSTFNEQLSNVQTRLNELSEWLKVAADRGKGLDNCSKRALSLVERMNLLGEAGDDEQNVDQVRWIDTTRRGFGIHNTPLDVAPIFQGHMQEINASWVFTSATLAVGENFNHFNNQLGLESPQTQALGSPFDFSNNALLYLPDALPEPSDPSYTRAVCTASLPVIEAAGGRTFMLFTSHRALNLAAEFLKDHLTYPILIQGDAPKQRLLNDFRRHGNAVLLGTASFWEGVDVRGSALSCVIIDKLPFASPGDPVLQARLNALKKNARNPFTDYQLPQAIVTLKQGAGRLIRDLSDTGVLVLCDPRLRSKNYGKIFLRSLPPMPITRSVDDVTNFLNERLSA